MWKIKDTPYYKKYYIFGKCIWKHQKSMRHIASVLLSKAGDMIAEVKSENTKNISNLRTKITDLDSKFDDLYPHMDELHSQITDMDSKLNGSFSQMDKLLENFTDLWAKIKEIQTETINIKAILSSNTDMHEMANIVKIIDKKILCDGLYTIEDWGAWINHTANIYLSFDKHTNHDVELHIELSKFCIENVPAQELIVFINNQYQSVFTTTASHGEIVLKVPYAELVKNNFKTVVSLLATNQKSPKELGFNNDERKISYGLVSVSANANIILRSGDSAIFYPTNKYKTSFMQSEWDRYKNSNDINLKLIDLSKNLSTDSIDIINTLLYRRTHEYSFSLDELYQKHLVSQNDISKYKPAGNIPFLPDVFYFKNGLKFLDAKIVQKHLSRGCVIDGGACSGDSALMFSEYDFVKKIYAFEPCHDVYAGMVNTLKANNCIKAEPVYSGLSDMNGTATIMAEQCDIITIDTFAKDKTVGCIKLDIEGMEYSVIKGAINTIKRDKPLLLICIYHAPKDFFEIKPMIESLNLGYKFKIVDTEPCNHFIGVHAMLLGYIE